MACDCCDERDIVLSSASDGVSITGASVDSSNQITFTLSNNTTIITNALTITDSGSIILNNDNTAQTTDVYTGGVPTQVGTKTYTVAANTLSTNGSELRIKAWLTKTYTSVIGRDIIWIYVGGSWFIVTSTYPGAESIYTGDSIHKILVEMAITRVDNTTGAVNFKGSIFGKNGAVPDGGYTGHHEYNPSALAAFNFTSNTIVVAVFAQSFDATDVNITCDQFIVEKILK